MRTRLVFAAAFFLLTCVLAGGGWATWQWLRSLPGIGALSFPPLSELKEMVPTSIPAPGPPTLAVWTEIFPRVL